jgi:ectoine hydroxylase-related dioxygenase (phytanoyl-CoA dioxygenase family)
LWKDFAVEQHWYATGKNCYLKMASGDSVAWRFQTEHAAFGSFPNVLSASRVAFALHAISANELAILATFIMHDFVKVLSCRPSSKLIFEVAFDRNQNFPFLFNF